MTTGAEIAVRLLKEAEVPLGPGLTESELVAIEKKYGFAFDRDHRELLSLALPLGKGWVDWRQAPTEDIQHRLDWPTDGVIWDVHNNDFWPKRWGRRPADDAKAEQIARRKLRKVPRLIPIYSHRFMAAGPSKGSAPVFSVMQTDVVYYGENLPSYVAHELRMQRQFDTGVHRHIPFWSNLAETDPDYLDWPQGTGREFRNENIEGQPFLPPKKGTPPGASPRTWKSFWVRNREEGEEIARAEGATLPDE